MFLHAVYVFVFRFIPKFNGDFSPKNIINRWVLRERDENSLFSVRCELNYCKGLQFTVYSLHDCQFLRP